MKNTEKGLQVQLYQFATCALESGEWSTPPRTLYSTGKNSVRIGQKAGRFGALLEGFRISGLHRLRSLGACSPYPLRYSSYQSGCWVGVYKHVKYTRCCSQIYPDVWGSRIMSTKLHDVTSKNKIINYEHLNYFVLRIKKFDCTCKYVYLILSRTEIKKEWSY
jgi:hypothetical protein